MREILLRGKRIDNGEWIFGISIHHAGRFTIVGNRWDNPELLEGKE